MAHYVPLLLFALFIRYAAPPDLEHKLPSEHPYSAIDPLSHSISSSLMNVSSLALTGQRPFVRRLTQAPEDASLSLMMLLVCGDVQTNPGPTKHLCMGCNGPVASNHRAMGCDQCGNWLHIKCGGITPTDYELFKAGKDPYVWTCPVCVLPCAGGSDSPSSSPSESDSFDLSENSGSSPPSNNNSRLKVRFADRLKIMSINVNSVQGKDKGAALKALIAERKPDIIQAQETNLTKDIVDSDFLPPKYVAIRHDKGKGKHGVFVAFREELVVNEVELPNQEGELVLAKVEVSGGPDIYVGSFYRHTNSDKKGLKSLFDNISSIHGGKKVPKVYLGGDFNLPDTDWDAAKVHPNPQYGKQVNEYGIEVINDLYLTQMVEEPTRGKNILDLFFSSSPSSVETVEVIPGISDHNAVMADVLVRAKTSKKKARKVFQYGRADQTKIKEELLILHHDFTKASPGLNADSCWSFFTERIQKIVSTHVPQKIIRERDSLPWLNRKLCKQVKRKNRTFSRYKKAKKKDKPRLWDRYTKEQKACQKEIKIAHEEYMESLFEDESGNPAKTFFRALKAKKKDNVGIAPLKTKHGKLESTPKGKAKILSDQYASVFKKDDGRPLPKMKGNFPSMKRIKVTSKGVNLLLKKLNPKKAIGPDQIPTSILKDHSELMADILQIIFQKSIDTGVIPLDWKTANVVAIHKKDCRNTASNYRPVSLTSISCKVLEHIVFSNVMDHADRHKILKQFQHGFRQQHSCETQLITTVDDLVRSLKDNQQVDMLILDFSKAFDVVGHRRLMGKLWHYGIRGDTHRWMQNWLTGRSQRVVVEGEASESVPVVSGVPQGTVLGPLMFIMYINDIADGTDSSVRLFADDALLYRVVDGTKSQSRLQWDLNQMSRWAREWQMDFNPKKCYVLSITCKRTTLLYPYTLNGVQLEHVKNHPYLGAQLDSTLSWNPHIDKTVKKAQRNLNLLRRNLHGCSQKTKVNAYKTMVRPNLEYASSAWDPYQEGHIDRLEAVQKKAARFVTGDHRRSTSASGLVSSLEWRTLQERRLIARLTMLFKAVNGLAAVTIPPEYKQPEQDSKFNVLHTRVDSYKFSFFPRTTRIWNLLPPHLTQVPDETLPDPTKFKNGIQEQFITGNMYTVSPRGIYDRPRLRSARSTGVVGPVY